MSATTPAVQWIGLDVSSTNCYAAKPGCKPRQFALSLAAVAGLVVWARQGLAPDAALCFALEHTGVYSQAWAALLTAEGVACALCNPARVHRFALSHGQRSKTDSADAQSILAFAQQTQPRRWVAPPAAEDQLAHYLTVRSAIKSDLQGWVNRRKAHGFLACDLSALEPILTALQAALQAAEEQIDTLVRQSIQRDPRLAAANNLLRSIPGIGEITAAVLCRWLTALASFSLAQLSAFSGLAPAHCQSGHSVRGKSKIDKAGPASLRCALYMAAVSAAHHCPGLSELYQRLVAAGRPRKVALCAVARRLLLLAQAVLKSGQPLRRQKAQTP